MSKLILPAAALFALTFAFASADQAEARGFHFSNGRVHVDVGSPHRSYGSYYNSYHGGRNYSNHYRVGYGSHYNNHSRVGYGGHSWHDTSHYDWHPTEYRRHGNHVDVTPGHYDWHQTGHVDHHHP